MGTINLEREPSADNEPSPDRPAMDIASRQSSPPLSPFRDQVRGQLLQQDFQHRLEAVHLQQQNEMREQHAQQQQQLHLQAQTQALAQQQAQRQLAEQRQALEEFARQQQASQSTSENLMATRLQEEFVRQFAEMKSALSEQLPPARKTRGRTLETDEATPAVASTPALLNAVQAQPSVAASRTESIGSIATTSSWELAPESFPAAVQRYPLTPTMAEPPTFAGNADTLQALEDGDSGLEEDDLSGPLAR